jgi:transcriptional regulator with XRE-family HTH domain
MESRLAQRVKAARAERGWTLEQLADASGVSRAAISKVERGEVSPTANVLARLAAGLGVSMASLFPPARDTASPLSRWQDQADWRDPASGYVRRNVSPAGASAEIVYVTFPAKARVVFDNYGGGSPLEQQVWLLEGEIEMTIGDDSTRLGAGDCLLMRLDKPITFANPTDSDARYAVIITRRRNDP